MSSRNLPGADQREAWTPLELASRLSRCPVAWAVAGGWALDLWRGQQFRPHDDIEISVSSAALGKVRECLPDHIFYAASKGALSEISPAEPVKAHQFWVLDPVAAKWRVDVMIDPGDEQCWVYRRDPRIHVPRREMLARSDDDIPYLRPQAVLLFKAKDPRPKDEIDFLNSVPTLASCERDWLKHAVQTAHPGSRWLQRLESEALG